jgi:hypothetical protein
MITTAPSRKDFGDAGVWTIQTSFLVIMGSQADTVIVSPELNAHDRKAIHIMAQILGRLGVTIRLIIACRELRFLAKAHEKLAVNELQDSWVASLVQL